MTVSRIARYVCVAELLVPCSTCPADAILGLYCTLFVYNIISFSLSHFMAYLLMFRHAG